MMEKIPFAALHYVDEEIKRFGGNPDNYNMALMIYEAISNKEEFELIALSVGCEVNPHTDLEEDYGRIEFKYGGKTYVVIVQDKEIKQ